MTQSVMRQMLEAGVHFGHQTRYWNPKMKDYIFGIRNKIHIVNLEKTLPLFIEAQDYVRRLAANKGTILFVGTKRQAKDIIKEEAIRCGSPYVDNRWLGGMLTNYKTIKQSVKRLEEKTSLLENASDGFYSKKELLGLKREVDKLERSLGGVRYMKGLPDAIFIIDTGYHHGSVLEANKVGIPIVGVVDTNNSPDNIQHIIPGNDDSTKSIRFYAQGIADAILEGKNKSIQDMENLLSSSKPKTLIKNSKEIKKDDIKQNDKDINNAKDIEKNIEGTIEVTKEDKIENKNS